MDPVLLEKMIEAYDSGMDLAVATIINSRGSTPRKAGAKLAVTVNGALYGTVGGGSGEARVLDEALKVLAYMGTAKININMTNEVAADNGMVCGGEIEVFIDTIDHKDSLAREILGQLSKALKAGDGGALYTITSDGGAGHGLAGKKIFVSGELVTSQELPPGLEILIKSVCSLGKSSRETELIYYPVELGQKIFNLELLAEPVDLPAEVLILGGGHIAVPLARMAEILGYRYSVVDDRPEFAARERFPGAEALLCMSFQKALEKVLVGTNTSVVIITRGHAHDRLCLREVLKKGAPYVGMIGSRRKVRGILDGLRQEGVEEERLESVYSPIGLDIGAETPEEIALSIFAEIVAVRRGGQGRSLKLQ